MMAAERPLDRNPYYVEHYEHLHRVLRRPHLAGIGIAGCVGAGIFVTSGSLIAITGSLGGVIAYIVAGSIVACVLYTITEMVASRPLTGSLIDLPHTFLDPAFGFAVGVLYTLASICSMATLTAQSAELAATLRRSGDQHHSIGTEVGINVLFIVLTTVSHCFGVKLYGRIERIIMWFKLGLFVLVCILMIVVNAGGGGPRQGPYNANYTLHGFSPGWKPTGFDSTAETGIKNTGVDDSHFGLTGAGGQLFAFLSAVTLAMFSCTGGEMVAMTAGEAKNPWQDVPVVMSFVYLVPLTLYPVTLLSAGANVNYADPNLPLLWARRDGIESLSPFVIAVRETSLHGLPKVLNLFFIISAYTAANTALYAASRSLFMLAQQYFSTRFANIFGRTNNGHTPLAAIGLCSALGFLSLVGLSQYAYSQPRITLSEFYTCTIACIYICLCFTFLRFKKGLNRLGKRKILSRDDPLYITRQFKSRWQPLPAYVGIFGCSFVIFWSGIPPIYILAAKGGLTSSASLKSTTALAFDVIGSYSGPILFAILYFTYKYIHPRSFRVDLRDLTPSHYVLGDLKSIEKEESDGIDQKLTNATHSHIDTNAVELDSPRDSRFGFTSLNTDRGKALAQSFTHRSAELSPEMQDEIEAQGAIREERRRIEEILQERPERLKRGFWRELWSFVVTDKD